MPATAINADFQYIFRPFRVLSPLSITMASTSLNYNLHKSTPYRIYIILCLIPPTAFGCQHFFTIEHQVFAPFTTTGAILTQWMLYFVMSVYLAVTFGKRRVEKLIIEIQELDILLRFKNKSVIFKTMVHNIVWIVFFFIFYGVFTTVYIFVQLSFTEGEQTNNKVVVYIIIWFNVIDLVMACEVACFSSMTIIFYTRMKHFVMYLNVFLDATIKDKQLNLTLCYRQIHRVLKRLEKAFHVQIALVIGFSFYSSLRMFLILTEFQSDACRVYVNILITMRYVGVFIVLGAVGQGVAVQLHKIKVLAALMAHSQNETVQLSGARLSAQAAVRPRGLGTLVGELDARLPLRMFGALAGVLIMLLQLGVNLENE